MNFEAPQESKEDLRTAYLERLEVNKEELERKLEEVRSQIEKTEERIGDAEEYGSLEKDPADMTTEELLGRRRFIVQVTDRHKGAEVGLRDFKEALRLRKELEAIEKELQTREEE